MSFDTLAPYYRGMEFVLAGRIMQRCRTAFLGAAINCRRALLLGEGPGRFLTELVRANPDVAVTCVEQSPRMIAVALEKLREQGLNTGRVEFVETDALRWQPAPAAFDLVVTNFFLDCFRRGELERLVAKVAQGTTPEAQWLLADFRVPDHGWQRWRARILLAWMYVFFRWATGLTASELTPADDSLRRAGFRLGERRYGNCGFVHADLWVKTKK